MRRLRILVTAGPTREHLDPIRFLTNASSGRMGFAAAEAAAARGHRVVLVTGPVDLPTPRGVRRVDVVSAGEMARQTRREFRSSDALIMTAAVADYTPVKRFRRKLRRSRRVWTVRLRPTADIVAGLSGGKRGRFLAGFALDTKVDLRSARRKLREKGLDVIVANTTKSLGSDRIEPTLIFSDGRTERLRPMKKEVLARRLIREVELGCRSLKASSWD